MALTRRYLSAKTSRCISRTRASLQNFYEQYYAIFPWILAMILGIAASIKPTSPKEPGIRRMPGQMAFRRKLVEQVLPVLYLAAKRLTASS
jgi:hypothetical protein